MPGLFVQQAGAAGRIRTVVDEIVPKGKDMDGGVNVRVADEPMQNGIASFYRLRGSGKKPLFVGKVALYIHMSMEDADNF